MLGWLILLIVFCWAIPRLDPTPTGPIVMHTITPDCVSGEQIARAYGWTGDWREYAWALQRVNHWQQWPTLHVGEAVWAIDCREPAGGSEDVDTAGRTPDTPRPLRAGR